MSVFETILTASFTGIGTALGSYFGNRMIIVKIENLFSKLKKPKEQIQK